MLKTKHIYLFKSVPLGNMDYILCLVFITLTQGKYSYQLRQTCSHYLNYHKMFPRANYGFYSALAYRIHLSRETLFGLKKREITKSKKYNTCFMYGNSHGLFACMA